MRRALLFLLALFIPTGVAAWLGVRNLGAEARDVESRFRNDAESAARAGAAALAAGLEDLRRDDPLALVATVDASGRAVVMNDRSGAASPESRPVVRRLGLEDVSTLRFQERALDAVDAPGALEEVERLLAPLVTISDRPAVAAWALASLGAIRRREGQEAAGLDAYRKLVQDFPLEVDERGLPRSFPARLVIARAEAGAAAAVALYEDLVRAHENRSQTAIAFLKGEARDLALARTPSGDDALRLAQARDADGRAERRRSLAAAFSPEIERWVAAAPLGAARQILLPSDPLDAGIDTPLILVVVAEAPRRVHGLEVRTLLERSLGRGEIAAFAALGFDVSYALSSSKVRVGTAPRGPIETSRAAVSPFDGVSIDVHAAEREAQTAGLRARSRWTAALVVVVLLFGVAAAIAIVRALRREVEAARAREQFVAAVTHELKTPIASIRLLAEILEPGDAAIEKTREFAGRIVAEADRLGRLVAAVLEWARLEHKDELGVALDPVDLASVADRVAAALEPLLRAKGFGLSVKRPDDPVRVLGNADALQGALMNLVDNAVKYSDAPHVIEIGVERPDARTAALAVYDRGRGVPAADAARIFRPFARAGDEMTRERPGVGLGLALVERIAAAHGGRALHERRDGGGSRFAILLPAVDLERTS